ncbi:MAG: ABC transporter ATP-binding protein [Pseudomonadota bacterium]
MARYPVSPMGGSRPSVQPCTEHSIVAAHGVSVVTRTGDVLLDDINLEVPPGSVLAIVGPNGAGKSTLLNLLSGVIAPSRGTVELDGQNLASLTPNQRARKIAVVGQRAEPDGRLPLLDYVALGQMPIWAEHSSEDHANALDQVLAVTALSALSDRPMAQLSGGECQRAHIARALAQRPALLFLDEPTKHLDPDAKGKMLSLVAGLGITVVMVVHDLVLIPEFATHVALLKDSRLTGFGPAPDVLTPHSVRATFGVDYVLLPYQGRQIAALDIRNTNHTH